MSSVGVRCHRLAVVVCAGFLTSIGCQSRPETRQSAAVPGNVEVAMLSPTMAFAADDKVISAETFPSELAVAKRSPVSREDILAWSLRGISDDVIIERIEQSGSTFPMRTSDEMHLHDAGSSDDVLRAMKANEK